LLADVSDADKSAVLLLGRLSINSEFLKLVFIGWRFRKLLKSARHYCASLILLGPASSSADLRGHRQALESGPTFALPRFAASLTSVGETTTSPLRGRASIV
jgi:hypothetical protein